MTIRKLIDILGALDKDMQIIYRTDYAENNFYVESFNSCRGNYEDIKLNCTANGKYKTAESLRKELIEMCVMDRAYTGYKGGEFIVDKDTKLTIGTGEYIDIAGSELQDYLHIYPQDGSTVCRLIEN